MSRCPICKKPTETAYAPFCSKRCADIDLSRWLGGAYKVETDEAPEIFEQMQNVQKDFD